MNTPDASKMSILPVFDAFILKRRLETILGLENGCLRAQFLLSEVYYNLSLPMVHTNLEYNDRNFVLVAIHFVMNAYKKNKFLEAWSELAELYNIVSNITAHPPRGEDGPVVFVDCVNVGF